MRNDRRLSRFRYREKLGDDCNGNSLLPFMCWMNRAAQGLGNRRGWGGAIEKKRYGDMQIKQDDLQGIGGSEANNLVNALLDELVVLLTEPIVQKGDV